eukprot:5591481-Pleurochrysis_carterae.AAC.1
MRKGGDALICCRKRKRAAAARAANAAAGKPEDSPSDKTHTIGVPPSVESSKNDLASTTAI